MSKERILYLPVETKAREFLGKTFLAARAAERGWTVILGECNLVREFVLDQPGGIYIEIGIPEKKAKRLEEMHAIGHRIANMCEEGLVYADGGEYCSRKLGPKCLNLTDRLLVVGAHNADHIRQHHPQYVDKLAVTGNPRFDTLLSGPRCVYERDAAAIRAEFGRFLLVNSNFTRSNRFGGLSQIGCEDHIAKLRKRGMIISAEHEAFYVRFVEHQRNQMAKLQSMLLEIRDSGAVDRIVVRPHPVEDRNTWADWGAANNIDVRWQGSAIEWMLAAEAMLHPGCTTAIEGLMLDCPIFSYVLDPDTEFYTAADEMSEIVSSADELIQKLAEVRGKSASEIQARFVTQRQKLGHFIANAEGPYAADRILDELDKMDLGAASTAMRAEKTTAIGNIFKTLRRWRGKKHSEKETRPERRRQKFPTLDKEEANYAVNEWVKAGVLTRPAVVDRLGEKLLVFR
jgi:surface carbohydrate biosynthesis protein